MCGSEEEKEDEIAQSLPLPTASSKMPSSRSVVDLIAERLQMYENAEEVAKSSGDTSKAKRMERGVKVSIMTVQS